MDKKTSKSAYIKIPLLTVAILLCQVIIDRLGWRLASLFDFSIVDKDSIFMAVSIHHICILLFSIGIIFIMHKWKNIDFKIKPKADKIGIKFTIIFCIAVMVHYSLMYIVGIATNSVGVYDYELNVTNVTGTLGFQLFLSGPAEEILYRALPLACLKSINQKGGKWFDLCIVILTSLLFVYAHVNFNFPLSAQLFSLLYVFMYSMAFGYAFIKSKSVIYPMIMHSISNVISVCLTYLYMAFYNAA